jgi:MFS family permease
VSTPDRPSRRGALLETAGAGLPGTFWRLWGSSAAANVADGIVLIAFPLAAIRLGASPGELAGLAIAGVLPVLLLGLVAGGLADRLDRRRTMLAVQVLRLAVVAVLGMLAATGSLGMPGLVAGMFALGVGEAFFDTNAQSILPMVVARDRLVAANGRLFAAETLANSFIGPPLGGLLVAIALPLAFAGAGVGFALAALGLVLMTGSYRVVSPAVRRSLAREIGEGVGYLAGHRLLLTLSLMVALGRLGSGAWFVLLALFAVAPGPMGLTEPQFGLLLVTFGVGSIIGTLVAGRLVARHGRPRVLLGATLVFGLTIALPAVTASPAWIGLGSVVAGISVMCWNVTNVSLRQAIVPPALLGRVHATHRLLAHTAGLLGAALAGLIGETLGLEAAFAIGAAITLLGLLGGFVVTAPRIARAEAEADLEASVDPGGEGLAAPA